MNKTLNDIARLCEATLTGDASGDTSVTSLLTDSRSLASTDGVLFCALTTGSSDGHRYIAELIRRGVRMFMVEKIPDGLGDVHGTAWLTVGSVRDAIERLGSAVRDDFDGTLVAITGSAGKTVVKEMIYRALLPEGDVYASPRSWNSRLGVPLALTDIPAGTRTAIIEVGIDSTGDMAHHACMLRPQIGLLTTITAEHDTGFASREDKVREKLRLFADCRAVIFDDSDPDIAAIVAEVCQGKRLTGVHGDNPAETDRLLTQAVLRELHAGDKAIIRAASEEPVSSRLDVHEGINDCLMVYDNFTHDLRSLRSALDFARRRSTTQRSDTVIMSDLLHADNDDPASVYAAAAAMMRDFGITRLIAAGPEIARHIGAFANIAQVECCPDTGTLLRDYDINRFSSETTLITGEPKEDFHAVKDLLESPRHDTIYEINLDSVVHNFNYYRSLLKPATGIVAMVKASGYGTGAPGIARTMQAQGAAYLAVAVVDEGVELRRAGITMPIMVLNPITTNYKALFDNRLEPSVFSMRELDLLRREARRCGVTDFPVHIKLDTGMHRVGFDESELPALADTLIDENELRAASIFSHLATADCLDMDDYTRMQLETFERASSYLRGRLPYTVRRHILNTAGMMRYPEYQYDMVRLGIGLYGVSPLPGDNPLKTVASLRSTIITIKRWPAGTTVGYGRRGVLTRQSVIATIPIGYADGVDRHLGCGAASFVVRGHECPTVGNICMDQCMIDITDVPDAATGDSVEIFGPQMPVERVAAILGTIPYEPLSTVSPRVKRIYYRE
ncbi:MAG: alanine racemase [Bacteroidales bacterium]|nr:alanine racemase [Bacteroidales bacterium]